MLTDWHQRIEFDGMDMLKRDGDSVLRIALDLEVRGKKKQGRPKRQLEEETEKIDLKKGYFESSKVEKWCASNCRKTGMNPAISPQETTPDKN